MSTELAASQIFEDFVKGSVHFAVNSIIASRSILLQLHNPTSHQYYILFYFTVLTNPIVNPRSHESQSNRSDSNQSHQSELKS